MFLLVPGELLFSLFGQAREQQQEHGQTDYAPATARQILVILAHPPIAAHPGQVRC
jgi:hypothetical protein